MEINLPYHYTLRDYQAPLWNALIKEKYKRAIYVWHRRAGKDLFGLNLIIFYAIFGTPGTYWHAFPTYKQGRKAIWEETDLSGRPYLDYIPEGIITRKNKTEMTIKFFNGSIYQIVGCEDHTLLKGSGIKGVVFSEYSELNPLAWIETIRPMLMASNGWALFNFTPKGQNHAYTLYEMAKKNKKWFTSLLTPGHDMRHIDDKIMKPSEPNTGSQVYTKESLEDSIREDLLQGKTIDYINQELFCSFANPIEGAYYSEQIKLAKEEGRITNLPYESNLTVDTFWDLGVNDTTAIWFTQQVGTEIRVIDYLEDSGKGLDHYIKEIKAKPYIYGNHNAPHDIRVREFSSGRSRYEIAYDLGIAFDVVPNIPIQDGINAARAIFNKCIFDETKCKKGLLALTNYKKQFDEIRNCFKDKPLHDWSSNGADAFRYLAVGIDEKRFLQNKYQEDYALT